MSKKAAKLRYRILLNGQVIACLRDSKDVSDYLGWNKHLSLTVLDTEVRS